MLIVNAGSSSLKVSLFDEGLKQTFYAHFKGINSEKPVLESHQHVEFTGPLSIQKALEVIIKELPGQPDLIGHRVVHGGTRYTHCSRVDDEMLKYLESISELAPLHNPACIEGITACRKLFGNTIPQYAAFDTAFSRNMPSYAKSYAVDPKYQIERFGFHGISHAFLWESYVNKAIYASKNSRIITLHLGNGCSVTAIHKGRCLDTSMGFTPAEGLVMATRAGDIDIGAVEFICSRHGLTISQAVEVLNRESGLLGLSGSSSDMKALLTRDDERAKLAIDLFCYRIRKYIGAYIAVLEGCNAIVFSGGIGENSPEIRRRIIEPFAWCSFDMDSMLNNHAVGLMPGDVRRIGSDVYVIATDENTAIAKSISAEGNPHHR